MSRDSLTTPIAIYKEFAQFLSLVRSYFLEQGFIETPTPTLVACPGMEGHLDPISTSTGHFLPTSPEIHLKRLLCQGLENIFEIRPCFRNDPKSDRHLSEFMMLEWYRTGASSFGDIQSDIQGLLNHLKAHQFWPHETNLKRTTFRKLFNDFFDFEFKPTSSVLELQVLFKQKGVHFSPTDSKEDLIHRLLIDFFEPSFRGPTLLLDFPQEMAVLSKIGTNGFAERFELFFGDMELANAFHEVTDPLIQAQRWERDLGERKKLGLRLLEPDEDLLRDMKELGLPQSSGIALGLERLFMAARGIKNISEIRVF